MKRLIALLALLPGSALAHGAHAPVASDWHWAAHLVPAAFAVSFGLLLFLAWRARQ